MEEKEAVYKARKFKPNIFKLCKAMNKIMNKYIIENTDISTAELSAIISFKDGGIIKLDFVHPNVEETK